MLIYKITNDVNDKLYFGQTTKTLEERIKNHRNSFVSGVDNHLYRAMRRYGWEKFHFHPIVEVDTQEELDALEEYYIAKYDTIRNGYNMAKGGTINVMYSDVIKARHDKKMRSPEVRKKISESLKATIKRNGGMSEEHRKRLSENKKAFYASERGQETKRIHHETFKLSESHRKALEESRRKSVYCIDLSGNLVSEFDRVKDASLWWQDNGYGAVKYLRTISAAIKRSADSNRYINGLKWIYRV